MKKQVTLLILFSCSQVPLSATTLVYNLRIRRVFSGLSDFLKKKEGALWIATAVPILYRRTAHIRVERFSTDVCDKRFGGGSVFNLRYVPSRTWWFEATTALQKETTRTTGTSTFRASRFALDDVVISGGYNNFVTKDTQLSFYGLVGFPTKRTVTPLEAQDRLVGTRFFALGGGSEISYSFINQKKKVLAGIVQLRVIHFFTRDWEPLVEPGGKIQPGQAIDLLMSLRYRKGPTAIEGGYNPTIFTNQALLLPSETIRTRTAVRHGIYANLTHLTSFKLKDNPVAVGTGFLANSLKRLNARSVSWWLTITVLF